MKAWLVERLQSFKTNCKKTKRKVIRRLKGQRFPPGFDEWCQQGPPNWRNNLNFKTYTAPGQPVEPLQAVHHFIRDVTNPGSHWLNVSFASPSSNFGEWNLNFTSVEARLDNAISAETTDIWSLHIGGSFASLNIHGLTAWNVDISITEANQPVRFNDCVIGKLAFTSPSGYSFELNNCWIGGLRLTDSCLKGFKIIGGGIARIDCPPADGPNPFKGQVTFDKVVFPTSSRQTALFENAQGYRSLHAHIKKHDNMLMANLMRSSQLRAERGYERGFAKFTNWVYGTFADYGRSPGRPLWWLLGLYVVAFGIVYACDGGTLMQPLSYYVGANASFLDENGGRLYRSLLLPLQSIVNALGVFFDARKMIVPTTTAGSVFLTIQGLVSDVLLLMTILSIRRRFKAD